MNEIMDDNWEMETFRILDKFENYPEDLTGSEKRRLLELGIKT